MCMENYRGSVLSRNFLQSRGEGGAGAHTDFTSTILTRKTLSTNHACYCKFNVLVEVSHVAWLCLHKYRALRLHSAFLWLCTTTIGTSCTTILLQYMSIQELLLQYQYSSANMQIEPRPVFALYSAAGHRASALQREHCTSICTVYTYTYQQG